MQELLLKRWVFSIALVFFVGCSQNNAPKEQKEKRDPNQTASLAKVKALTEKAYDHKLRGQNGQALAHLKKAGKILSATYGEAHYKGASNLDDLATVYLRTGDFTTARKLYLKAQTILKKIGQDNSRLAKAVDRRLHTLTMFEKNHITCSEPMEPKSNMETGGLPYFPRAEELEPVLDLLAKELGDCTPKQKRPVPVRLVITGRGGIVEAHVKGLFDHTEVGLCIEKQILKLAPKYTPALPRFRACYKNVTYPFVIDGL
ncbi:MAG: tetratricopeptide repeat protein [Proteobacteria bacterium]|nr:tetratricopeptide repeat protein [Pseudomonadota bacterium]